MSLLGRVCIPMVPEPGRVRQEDYGEQGQPRLHSQACLHLPTPLKLVSESHLCVPQSLSSWDEGGWGSVGGLLSHYFMIFEILN